MRILDYIYLLWAPNSRAIPQDATTSSPNYLQSHLNRQPTLPLPAETSKSPSTVPVGSTNGQQQQQQQQRSVSAQLFDAGKVDLFYTLTSSHDDTKPKAAVLNLCTLQNLALRQLQHDISRYVGDMYGKTEFVAKLEGLPPLSVLLSRYSDAVRNLDFMKQCALRGYEKDPFLMRSTHALERRILETSGLIPNHVLPSGELPLAEDHADPQLRDISRNQANRDVRHQKRLSRFVMAASGGLLLVVPMLIMANVPGKVSSLVTTCVALVIFSALIALFTELGPHEILATTAAYAAVLVVFVGTSMSSQTVVVRS